MLRYIVRMIAVRLKALFKSKSEEESKHYLHYPPGLFSTGWLESEEFREQVKGFEDEGRAGKLYDKGETT